MLGQWFSTLVFRGRPPRVPPDLKYFIKGLSMGDFFHQRGSANHFLFEAWVPQTFWGAEGFRKVKKVEKHCQLGDERTD